MLTKKVGSKLEITSKEQSKVFGGTCGQPCFDSCPARQWKKFGTYSAIYLEWRATPW
jgi:hypothetical protein